MLGLKIPGFDATNTTGNPRSVVQKIHLISLVVNSLHVLSKIFLLVAKSTDGHSPGMMIKIFAFAVTNMVTKCLRGG